MSLEVSPRLASVIIMVVTITELYLGGILLLKLDLKYSLRFAIAVMFLFSVFLFFLSTMAKPPSCGCMGLTAVFHSNRHNAIFGLLRNCVILWVLKGAYDFYVKPGRTPNSLPG